MQTNRAASFNEKFISNIKACLTSYVLDIIYNKIFIKQPEESIFSKNFFIYSLCYFTENDSEFVKLREYAFDRLHRYKFNLPKENMTYEEMQTTIKSFLEKLKEAWIWDINEYENRRVEVMVTVCKEKIQMIDNIILKLDQLEQLYLSDNIPNMSFELKESLEMLVAFVSDDSVLKHKLSKKAIANQLLSIIINPNELNQSQINPNELNQSQANVCGVAVYLRELAEKSPCRFVLLGMNLAKTGYSEVPFKIQSTNELNQIDDITLTMMCAIRNITNLSGYHKDSIFESLQGATFPKDFETWFQQSGFEILIDTLTLFNKDNQPISGIHFFMLNSASREGIYSNRHTELTCKQTLNALTSALSQPDQGCFMFISNTFNQSLLNKTVNPSPEQLLGVDYGHYIKITGLHRDEENSPITLTFYTLGEIKTQTIELDYFKKHCHGILITKFTKPFDLTQKNQNQRDDGNCRIF